MQTFDSKQLLCLLHLLAIFSRRRRCLHLQPSVKSVYFNFARITQICFSLHCFACALALSDMSAFLQFYIGRLTKWHVFWLQLCIALKTRCSAFGIPNRNRIFEIRWRLIKPLNRFSHRNVNSNPYNGFPQLNAASQTNNSKYFETKPVSS